MNSLIENRIKKSYVQDITKTIKTDCGCLIIDWSPTIKEYKEKLNVFEYILEIYFKCEIDKPLITIEGVIMQSFRVLINNYEYNSVDEIVNKIMKYNYVNKLSLNEMNCENFIRKFKFRTRKIKEYIEKEYKEVKYEILSLICICYGYLIKEKFHC